MQKIARIGDPCHNLSNSNIRYIVAAAPQRVFVEGIMIALRGDITREPGYNDAYIASKCSLRCLVGGRSVALNASVDDHDPPFYVDATATRTFSLEA
jgi:hypothetical protein